MTISLKNDNLKKEKDVVFNKIKEVSFHFIDEGMNHEREVEL